MACPMRREGREGREEGGGGRMASLDGTVGVGVDDNGVKHASPELSRLGR